MPATRSGVLFIVSSPSGGGKTTLIREVIARLAERGFNGHFSVSHTTRTARSNETDGIHYHFIERETFEAMADRGEFLEWAEYAGSLYGTSRREVEDPGEGGRQGAGQPVEVRRRDRASQQGRQVGGRVGSDHYGIGGTPVVEQYLDGVGPVDDVLLVSRSEPGRG